MEWFKLGLYKIIIMEILRAQGHGKKKSNLGKRWYVQFCLNSSVLEVAGSVTEINLMISPQLRPSH